MGLKSQQSLITTNNTSNYLLCHTESKQYKVCKVFEHSVSARDAMRGVSA